MPPKEIHLDSLTIRLVSPMHIGTGAARGLINRTIVRGRDGLAYVPGSTLKGKTRDACEALADLYEIGCRGHAAGAVEERRKCIVCRVFGGPGQPSGLRWHSARLSREWIEALGGRRGHPAVFGQTTTRTQVQLSRLRGTAAEARLFTSELAASELTFLSQPALSGRCRLTPMRVVDDPDVYYELVLLCAGLRLVARLGGGQSRGAGECEITLPQSIRVGRQEIPVERQLANVEGLTLFADEVDAE